MVIFLNLIKYGSFNIFWSPILLLYYYYLIYLDLIVLILWMCSST